MNTSSKQFQAILGSVLGDGHISKKNEFSTGCKHLEYIEYKYSLLSKLCTPNWYMFLSNNPFNGIKTEKSLEYHKLQMPKSTETLYIAKLSLIEKLDLLTPLGLAIWLYDDVSLHKTKYFYNLCTHSFSKKEHENILIPFFKSINLNPTLAKECKADGRIFYYLRFNKTNGGVQCINKYLKKIHLNCYKYKLLPIDFKPSIYYVVNGKKFKYLSEISKEFKIATVTINKYIGKEYKGLNIQKFEYK